MILKLTWIDIINITNYYLSFSVTEKVLNIEHKYRRYHIYRHAKCHIYMHMNTVLVPYI